MLVHVRVSCRVLSILQNGASSASAWFDSGLLHGPTDSEPAYRYEGDPCTDCSHIAPVNYFMVRGIGDMLSRSILYDCRVRELWSQRGRPHRETQPAVVYTCGALEWRENGLLHRAGDMPAATRYVSDGDMWAAWCTAGVITRDSSPAFVFRRTTAHAIYGSEGHTWYSSGVLHKNGEPASVGASSFGIVMKWCQNGYYHREAKNAFVDSHAAERYWFTKGKLIGSTCYDCEAPCDCVSGYAYEMERKAITWCECGRRRTR